MATTYWKNREEWVCARHLPSINIPASEGQCFFSGCVSVRPKNRPSVEDMKEVKVVASSRKEKTTVVSKKKTEAKVEAQVIDSDKLCVWINCDKGENGGRSIRKARSKYCSRDCSNKNARWRHKQRKN